MHEPAASSHSMLCTQEFDNVVHTAWSTASCDIKAAVSLHDAVSSAQAGINTDWVAVADAFPTDSSTVELVDLARHVLHDRDDSDCASDDAHRSVSGPGLWNAMVTKPLHPKDPLCRSERAKAALDKELSGLRSAGAWDEDSVMEASASEAGLG